MSIQPFSQVISPPDRPRLLVIADDLTGANDTGVQFAKKGIKSVVLVGWEVDELPTGFEVVVVNTESRHVAPGIAAERVKHVATLGGKAGTCFIFKKTDSTLRGNIGAELEALRDVTGEAAILFIPAFPEMGRITRGGIHFVHGVPIGESAFARDPLSPVRDSEVAKILQRDVPLRITSVRAQEWPESLGEGCIVVDCESRADLRAIADWSARNKVRVLAGSAALAEELPRVLPLRTETAQAMRARGPILLVNGSLNPRALEQIANAGDEFQKLKLLPEIALSERAAKTWAEQLDLDPDRNTLLFSARVREDYDRFKSEAAALGLDEFALHLRIANCTGAIVKHLLRNYRFGTLIVFGGDTLMGIARANQWEAFVPRTEVEAGITVANPMGSGFTVISKAGGFGDAGVVSRVVEWVRRTGPSPEQSSLS